MQWWCQIIFNIWMMSMTKTAAGFRSQTRDLCRDQSLKKKHMTHWNKSSRLHTGWLLIFSLCTCQAVLWIQLLAAMPRSNANFPQLCYKATYECCINLFFTHLCVALETLPASQCPPASWICLLLCLCTHRNKSSEVCTFLINADKKRGGKKSLWVSN